MKYVSLLLTALLLICSVAPALALERLTLSHALAETMQERPMVRASAAEVAAAEATTQVRASRYLPRLRLSEHFVRTNEPAGSFFASLNQERFELSPDADAYNDPPARSNFETRLTLAQPLYDPDLKYERERAELNQQAVSALHGRHREEAALATLLAYLGVQQSQARLAWAEKSLAEAEELLAMSREREQAGTGLHADSLRGEVLRNDAQRQRLTARNSVYSAQRRLALAVGRPNGMVDIAAPAGDDLIPLPDPTATVQRGDLAAMAKTVNGAELATHQRQAAYLPRLGLQASYFWNQRNLDFGEAADAWSISAGLEWQLFDAGERSSAVAGARAKQLALEMQQREQQRQVRLAIAEAVQAAEEAVARLDLARSSLAAAEASRELVTQRYGAGLATMSDLLGVQSELARVRSELAAAETGLISARAQIYYQQGTLLQVLLPESETQP